MHYYHLKPRRSLRDELPPLSLPVLRRGRALPALGRALLGALCGVLLAAFATSVSGSVLGVSTVILVGVVIGGAASRLPGAVVGALYGGLAAFALSAMGGSAPGRVLTVAACALLAGWLQWTRHGRARCPRRGTEGPGRAARRYLTGPACPCRTSGEKNKVPKKKGCPFTGRG
jgi:hypothetical protein